jgi:4-amino-4-deoxy-L-arabinose transferase-like glycosyltransferase
MIRLAVTRLLGTFSLQYDAAAFKLLSDPGTDAMSIAVELQPSNVQVVRQPISTAWLHATPAHVCMLSIWSLLLFLYGIHQGELYRTEGLRAIIGAEMYRSGDWIVPRLYGEPILTKPPLFYWCIAIAGHLFGEVTTWTTRLPAALSGWLAVLLVYFTMRRYYDKRLGLLAALALPVSFLWLDKGSSAEIDTMLVMWVLAAWSCFVRALVGVPRRCGTPHLRANMQVLAHPHGGFATQWSKDSSNRSETSVAHNPAIVWWLLALFCVAGGVLTKWTGFLFFYAMAIPTLLWHRRLLDLFRWPHLLGALLGVGLVWLWLGAVVAELGWAQVWASLWREGAPRVLHGKNASQHLLIETAIHPFKVLAIALPWSIVALLGWWRTRANDDTRTEAQRFVEHSLWCWAVAGTVMMTAFPDHNTRQSFSLVPAWTLLGVLSLWRLAGGRVWKLAGGLLLCWVVVKVAYVEMLIPARYAKRPVLAEQAEELRAFVPPAWYLWLKAVKDECLMFNFGQPVRRVAGWEPFAVTSEACCILTEAERQAWPAALAGRITAVRFLRDAQGDPLVVVRLRAVSIP